MKKVIIAKLLGLGLATAAHANTCNAPLPSPGSKFAGPVHRVLDGDTFCIGEDQGGIQVRTADFNACELDEPGGRRATETLGKMVMGKRVECVAERQSSDEIVSYCIVDGQRIGRALRRRGSCEGGHVAE